MAQQYSKPHLTHAQQLAQLVDQGLACCDETAAIDLLKTVGYYRLSAYIYPFRELMSGSRGEEGPGPYRSDRVRDGITFDHIEALWRFDRKLRLVCLDAVETVETGLPAVGWPTSWVFAIPSGMFTGKAWMRVLAPSQLDALGGRQVRTRSINGSSSTRNWNMRRALRIMSCTTGASTAATCPSGSLSNSSTSAHSADYSRC